MQRSPLRCPVHLCSSDQALTASQVTHSGERNARNLMSLSAVTQEKCSHKQTVLRRTDCGRVKIHMRRCTTAAPPSSHSNPPLLRHPCFRHVSLVISVRVFLRAPRCGNALALAPCATTTGGIVLAQSGLLYVGWKQFFSRADSRLELWMHLRTQSAEPLAGKRYLSVSNCCSLA